MWDTQVHFRCISNVRYISFILNIFSQTSLITISDVKAFHAEGYRKEDIFHRSNIEFRNVKTNIGGCYNPANSTFTCKDKGLYHFYVTILSHTQRGYGQVWYDIVQDGRVMGYGITGNGETGQVGGIYAMIRCSIGSHVWVKQSGYRPGSRQAKWGPHFQFGGFKIAK